MAMIVLLARLLLAAVFGVAGFSKLADPAGSERMLLEFGLPAPLSRPVAWLLPLLELAAAVALLPLISAWWGALASLVLLLLFAAAIGANLARGRRPDCLCFGQIASGAIGVGTLIRNALLALIAGFVIWQGRAAGGISAVAWIGDLSAIERVWLALGACAVALIAVEAGVLLQLMGQNGRMLLQLQNLQSQVAGGQPQAAAPGLAIGLAAPELSLPDLDGRTRTLTSLRAGDRPVLLLFTDPDCGPCSDLLPDLGRWQRELAQTLNLALLSRGTAEANRAKTELHKLQQVLLQNDREIMEAFQARGTPAAVLVMADGTIGSALAQGSEEIRALVARLAAGDPLPLRPYSPAAPQAPAMPEPLPVGAEAPPLKLPDLNGREVDLADYRGRETLVLFWSPGCGFCQQMLPLLKDFEQKPPGNAPALLVVSNGTPDANAEQGLSSTIVLDQLFAVGQAFGATGTPSGVLVDADGKIATPLAVGAAPVMALANPS